MEDFKNVFPILSAYTYLNTASSGLLPRTVYEWRKEEDTALFQKASLFRDTQRERLDETKKAISRFLEVPVTEIALIPNFSFGFNAVLESLPKGSKVLLLENDYPSINWAVEHKGFEICTARVDADLEQHIEQAVAEHHPNVFAFSITQYQSGITIDMEFLKQLKAYHPHLLLIADGTQYLGATAFSFADSPLDVLGCSCYKWMLSGYGNGMLLIKEAARELIRPRMIGFNSADAVFGKKDEIPYMRLFEPGHQDTLSFGSIGKAIAYLETIGIDAIAQKNALLLKRAGELLAEKGVIDEKLLHRNTPTTILNMHGDDTLFQKLNQENIICSQRGKGIRVSFHFYNTTDDLERLVSVL